MKTGKTLTQLAQELERQKDAKRDFIVPTQATEMVVGSEAKNTGLIFGDQMVGINALAHSQIADHTGIPQRYYDKMKAEAPGLLANNVNEWFRKYPAPRMIRTMDGAARAFLSDRYRPLDNVDFMEAALPPLIKAGVEIVSCDVTETKLYLKVVDARIKADLPVPLGQGHERFRTVAPALVLSNSEVGAGALAIQTSVWEEGCTNLMIISERSQRRYHVGARHDITGEEVYAMLSQETRAQTDKALWMQIGDMVTAAFDRARFDAQIDKLKAAMEDRIEGDPAKVVEITAKKFGMTDGERGSVLRSLIQGGDLSRYGLQWAVTHACQGAEFSYDRATEFEAIGGKIIELPKREFMELAKAA